MKTRRSQFEPAPTSRKGSDQHSTGGFYRVGGFLKTFMDSFYDKIESAEDCWIWGAAIRGKTGYGCVKYNGKLVDAHRVSYMVHIRDIPKGLLVCHTCDNRKCVNPDHLFLGTHTDNMQDCKKKGRIKAPQHARIHPSYSSYRRGCRCLECVQIHALSKNRNALWMFYSRLFNKINFSMDKV